ncbi:MAG: M56 family metallopeptidase [Bacteroidaceae bacterium]|nr:M56 family metallopeptidase [Bacteroidaceae bacterium]
MMTFLTYQLKVAVIMAVFYIFYRLFLSKDAWHRLNRIVLLSTALLSFLLPVCIITIHKTEVIHIANTLEPLTFHGTAEVTQSFVPWWHVALTSVYLVGVAFVLFRIAASILRVRSIIRNARKEVMADGTVVYIMPGNAASFSWMGHIVISEADWNNNESAIIRHEKAHVALRHSIDVLITDLIAALQWFNPAIWMLRIDLRAVHEYEADDTVLRDGTDLRSYQYLLISKAAAMNGYTIANNFNHSILKNRIFMMEKETSTRRSLLRALYLLPLVCISLALNAQTKINYVYNDNQADQSPKVTVIKATLNQDSLEFTGTAVYDLIKSLPGVQFDEDANITVNGKPVSKVLMDGKTVYENKDSRIPDHTIRMNYTKDKEYVSYTDTIYSTISDGRKSMSISSGMFKTDANDPRLNDVAKVNISLSLSDDANIEEEIRKLPGVEIDDDSSITVNGKPVSKVLVNGESYSPNFVNDKVSYDTVMEKEESSIGLWDKSIHVDYYKKCLTAIGITDDIYSLIVVPSGGGRVAEIKLGTKDEAIKAIENMISSYKTGNTLEIDGYTINGIKGKVYSISHTGPLERAISGSNYIFRIKGLKKVL